MNHPAPFTRHLEELRVRILYSAAGIIAATAGSFIFYRFFLELIKAPIPGELIFIAPQEAFIVALKVSLLAGIIISFPFTVYQLWKFIQSGLKPREKKLLYIYFPFALLLFGGGVAFAFLVVLPAALNFLLGFGGGSLSPAISIRNYVSFAFSLLLAFGVIFQLPLVMRMVSLLGITDKKALRSGRKYSAVIIFALSALLTPPDIFSQIALALPALVLYELGIIISPKIKAEKL